MWIIRFVRVVVGDGTMECVLFGFRLFVVTGNTEWCGCVCYCTTQDNGSISFLVEGGREGSESYLTEVGFSQDTTKLYSVKPKQ